MVEIDEAYAFEGPNGTASLLDVFEGRHQLIVGHFMFDPSWGEGRPSCSAGADEISAGLLEHLHARDTTLVQVSRRTAREDRALQGTQGLDLPLVLLLRQRLQLRLPRHARRRGDSRRVQLPDQGRARAGGTWQFAAGDEPIEMPGTSYFLRDGDLVFHTYSTYARGAEMTGGSYYFLDLTALGRQEDWEEPQGRAAAVRGAVPDFSSWTASEDERSLPPVAQQACLQTVGRIARV